MTIGRKQLLPADLVFRLFKEAAKFIEPAGDDCHFVFEVPCGLRESLQRPFAMVGCQRIADQSLQTLQAAGEGFIEQGDKVATVLTNFFGDVLHQFPFGLAAGGGENSGGGADGLAIKFVCIDESAEGGFILFCFDLLGLEAGKECFGADGVGAEFQGILHALTGHAEIFEFAVESSEIVVGIEHIRLDSDCFAEGVDGHGAEIHGFLCDAHIEVGIGAFGLFLDGSPQRFHGFFVLAQFIENGAEIDPAPSEGRMQPGECFEGGSGCAEVSGEEQSGAVEREGIFGLPGGTRQFLQERGCFRWLTFANEFAGLRERGAEIGGGDHGVDSVKEGNLQEPAVGWRESRGQGGGIGRSVANSAGRRIRSAVMAGVLILWRHRQLVFCQPAGIVEVAEDLGKF